MNHYHYIIIIVNGVVNDSSYHHILRFRSCDSKSSKLLRTKEKQCFLSRSLTKTLTFIHVVLLHGHPTEIEGERQPKHLFAGSNPGCGNRSSQSQCLLKVGCFFFVGKTMPWTIPQSSLFFFLGGMVTIAKWVVYDIAWSPHYPIINHYYPMIMPMINPLLW